MAKRKRPRGYPVAIIIAFEARRAVLWQVFSKIVKPFTTIRLARKREDLKAVYAFHEGIVDSLRPVIREGLRSVLLIEGPKMNYAVDFQDHVQKHHLWLVKSKRTQGVRFGTLEGSAGNYDDVIALVQSEAFQTTLAETTSEEAGDLLLLLDRRLSATTGSDSFILYPLDAIANFILQPDSPVKKLNAFILLNAKYLDKCQEKNRLDHVLQVARNKGAKTRVINEETPAGARVMQFGGIVCMLDEAPPKGS